MPAKEDLLNIDDSGFFIHVKDLALSRGGDTLFEGMSFELCPGERLAVMGGSGTGKSSVLLALLGRAILHSQPFYSQRRQLPTIMKGEIFIGGIPHQRMYEWPGWLALHAGVLFQSGALFDGRSVQENLSFPFRHGSIRMKTLPRNPSPEQLGRLLEKVELPGSKNTPGQLEDFLRRQVTELSGGQRKRLALARSLALGPDLLMLDEPTSGLDAETSQAIAETIHELSNIDGVAVLCISHDPVFVDHLKCHALVRIQDGNCFSQTLEQVSAPTAARIAEGQTIDSFSPTAKEKFDQLTMVIGQAGVRFFRLLLEGAMICAPVALIAGAGLVIQAVFGPRLIQQYLAQGVVAGVFLGMGTIVPALLVIGLSGSGMTGELVQRKHNDQLEYLRLLGISPISYLGIPILLALMAAMPLLIMASEYLMILGGRLVLLHKTFEARSAVTSAFYWEQAWRLITSEMWHRSAIKGITHGAVIGMTVCACGFFSGPGERGLRRAIAYCVLIASLLIIIADVLWSWNWAG